MREYDKYGLKSTAVFLAIFMMGWIINMAVFAGF